MDASAQCARAVFRRRGSEDEGRRLIPAGRGGHQAGRRGAALDEVRDGEGRGDRREGGRRCCVRHGDKRAKGPASSAAKKETPVAGGKRAKGSSSTAPAKKKVRFGS